MPNCENRELGGKNQSDSNFIKYYINSNYNSSIYREYKARK